MLRNARGRSICRSNVRTITETRGPATRETLDPSIIARTSSAFTSNRTPCGADCAESRAAHNADASVGRYVAHAQRSSGAPELGATTRYPAAARAATRAGRHHDGTMTVPTFKGAFGLSAQITVDDTRRSARASATNASCWCDACGA